MPPAGILAAAALAAIGYLYVGRPIAHGVKRAGQAIGHTIHHKPKPKETHDTTKDATRE